MRKLIIVLFFLINFTVLNSKELNILNVFKLDFPNDIIFNKYAEEICNKNNKIVVASYYVVKYLKYEVVELRFYLKVNDKFSEDYIENFTKISEISNYIHFGMGDIYKTIQEDQKNVDILNLKNGLKIKKYITHWASGMSSDLLLYNFKLDHKLFNECLIEFVNIYQTTKKKFPDNLKTPFIDDLIAKNDKSVYFYKLLDDTIKNIELLEFDENAKIEPTITYLTPKVDNLRFRESPDTKGKYIRTLKLGEKLELLEKGKGAGINGVMGTWVKVKTEKGEIGWCFDGYLDFWNEEVKKK